MHSMSVRAASHTRITGEFAHERAPSLHAGLHENVYVAPGGHIATVPASLSKRAVAGGGPASIMGMGPPHCASDESANAEAIQSDLEYGPMVFTAQYRMTSSAVSG